MPQETNRPEADEDAKAKGKGESLSVRTARDIATAIIGGEFAFDGSLPVESDMMSRFDVSRNVLREAVKMLVGKGILRTVRRAGTFVQPKRKWNLLDTETLAWTIGSHEQKINLIHQLTQLRSILEPEVAALAAANATVTETLKLHEAYDAMERNRSDAGKAIEADILFHQRLFESSHNDLICSLLPALTTLLRANFEFSIDVGEGFIRNLEEHRLVAEAVRFRDPDLARKSMRTLLQNNEEDIEAMLKGTDRDRYFKTSETKYDP
jgi:DNA-binding FadR family transcriptional regulator